MLKIFLFANKKKHHKHVFTFIKKTLKTCIKNKLQYIYSSKKHRQYESNSQWYCYKTLALSRKWYV